MIRQQDIGGRTKEFIGWKALERCWLVIEGATLHRAAAAKFRVLDGHLSFPKAGPEAKTCVRVVYLECGPQKANEGVGKVRWERRGENVNKVHINMKVTAAGDPGWAPVRIRAAM